MSFGKPSASSSGAATTARALLPTKAVLLAALAMALASTEWSLAIAQAPAAEHAGHHPGSPPPSAAPEKPKANVVASAPKSVPAVPAATGMTDPMSSPPDTKGMAADSTGCCGGPGAKPFYPSLMDMPKLTDETRQTIRAEAVSRLGSGSQMISTGQDDLQRAQSSNNFPAAQTAVSHVREGLSLAGSGSSALQALDENQPPPRIGLIWFKRELAVTPDSDMIMDGGFRSLSWVHLVAMLLLAAALAAALLIRMARLRRITALAQRLTPGGPPPSAPPAVETQPEGGSPIEGAKLADGVIVPVKRPWKGVLRITAIFDETPTVKTFRLMEPNLGTMPFTFLPGQYATITSKISGQTVRRSYTISSSPTQREYIELTVKREDQGLESRYLHDHATTGDLLEITAPSGNFFFTGKEAKGIVLIAGGVGITPMMSVLRHLTDRSYEHEIHLIYGVRTPVDMIFREECAYLASRHPNVTILSIVASAEGTDWTGPVGFISADFIAGCVSDIARRRIHLCGPPPMMKAVKAALSQLKVPSEQIKTEDFAPPKGGPVLADDGEATRSNILPRAATSDAVPGAAPSAQATVNFSRSNRSGTLAPDQSVLEAAEAIGVVIDFECRVGTCGRCKVPLLQGSVTMEVEDSLEASEKADGIILACQAKSPGDLIVDA